VVRVEMMTAAALAAASAVAVAAVAAAAVAVAAVVDQSSVTVVLVPLPLMETEVEETRARKAVARAVADRPWSEMHLGMAKALQHKGRHQRRSTASLSVHPARAGEGHLNLRSACESPPPDTVASTATTTRALRHAAGTVNTAHDVGRRLGRPFWASVVRTQARQRAAWATQPCHTV
jgi:hypothetical protein